MKWTKELPTEPGYYLMAGVNLHYLKLVRVHEKGGVLLYDDIWRPRSRYLLPAKGSLWHGPIEYPFQEPEEA